VSAAFLFAKHRKPPPKNQTENLA